MHSSARAQGKVGALPERVVGAIAYLSFVPALIFLQVDPYRRNRFVRFHSLQCLLLTGAVIALAIALRLIGLVLFIIPVLGPLLVLLVDLVALLATVLVWIVLIVKALQGETFKLPRLGDFAEQHADSSPRS